MVLAREVEPSFAWYLRYELDTYSQDMLKAYLDLDVKRASLEGKNLVIEAYCKVA